MQIWRSTLSVPPEAGHLPLLGESNIEQSMTTKFINPTLVIAQTGLKPGDAVADLGCGNGFYVLPAAQMVGGSGTVFAVDVVESKLEATASLAKQFGHKNVRVVRADLEKPILDLAENSVDLVILGNILHEIGNREPLIKNAYRILKSGGNLLVVEWKKEVSPLGPAVEKRINQNQLEESLGRFGFVKVKDLEVDGYHYANLFTK